MSEYLLVEKPFLDQLKDLGWTIINHGENYIPQDPKVSLRDNFREIVIKKEFKKWVKKINKTDTGIEWLTDKQLDELYNMITKVSCKGLLETNKAITELLIETKPRVDRNEVTGKENPAVKLIDFENPENNHFLAINQFRVDTVGTAKKFIIPDIVLFVNGIPIVVVECKVPSSFASDAMEEGIRQLLRYQNRRLNTEGKREKEGEEALFYYNQFMISTYGDEARVGTISSDYEHYLEWKSIYPKKFEEFNAPLGKKRSQEILIQGMLNKENLLKIVKHFTIFKPVSEKKEIKIVCRYQQFRAVQKIIDKLLNGDNYLARSGVIWHTQGSGKSLTMIFLVRQMRFMDKLKDYKIIMVNDRTDLEQQLGETAKLTGETVHYVERANQLKTKLSGNSSDLTLVMMHKFSDKVKEKRIADSLIEAGIIEEDMLPEIEELGVVNDSERIIILIDESHRTQNNPFGLAGNLFKAFPNSTKIAFTGTPLITDRHKKKTTDIFGDYIDKYRAKDSVKDGATLQILYVGRKDKIKLVKEAQFDFEFSELFKNKSEKEIQEINKRYGTYRDFLESDDHIKTVSKDIIDHYAWEILINGFKAQVVCISKIATVKYKRFIDEAIEEKIVELENGYMKDNELIKKLKFLKTAIVISDDGNDPADMARLSKESKKLNAVSNFKKEYDYEKPETGIGILIVCSRLLTGFDAPIEQVMYLDKIMKEHTLFQAITRVNRTYKNKYKGYIVDYVGISGQLAETLRIYSGDDEGQDGFRAIDDINTEKPILRDRYNRLINLFLNKGVTEIKDYVLYNIKDPMKQYEVLEKCIEVCENVQTRARFEVYYKRYLSSLDILINLDIDEKYRLAMRAFGHIQARIRHRFKDDSLNLAGVSEKVKELINKHVESEGISNKIPPLELFDVDFKENLDKHKNSKAKASEMEHAMRKEINLKRDTDPALYDSFLEKLKEILKRYSEDMEARFKAMEQLYEEMKKGRKGIDYNNGLDPEKEAPFYDLLINKVFKDISIVDNEEHLKSITCEIVRLISREIRRTNFWGTPAEIETLKSNIGEILLFSNIEKLEDNEALIASEFVNLAKSRHDILVS
ncbi:type I restriction endonuclease subunit R [Paramaledivibacter caminithermalis]|jgi:type I restriction enzyme R subunit|uniref:Type I restriction enzyme endonuclease subunit n=1 Tax=Paramaledivibacter caminithermalis (strain DSM 15212 / CIP 107654 / DViRD3) TaxID=1121301 RepID=A0A1M6RDV4_PARC5|nr:HsdR family type I site-specific deoxyribonuclease [Paramaledivibacter caminithermalis]SHK30596.1 type I restriction enzyme, R subunit [Paramaledivibacter caminithermalis DSM 15212]